MTDFPRRYLTDEKGERIAVVLDLETFTRIERELARAADEERLEEEDRTLERDLVERYGDPSLTYQENVARLEEYEDLKFGRMLASDADFPEGGPQLTRAQFDAELAALRQEITRAG